MTIDISKIRPGDEVTVRAVVVHKSCALDQWQLCWPDHPGATLWAFPEHIVSHTPKELQPGDRVRLRPHGGEGYVRAIVGHRAWVDRVDDPSEMLNGYAYGLSELERV